MTMNYTNPYINPQARMEQLVSQYPQFFNQQTQQAMQIQSNGYKVFPVTNRAEANSTPADMSGAPIFFYNKAENEVLMKQFDTATGMASLKVFKLEDTAQAKSSYDKRFEDIEKKLKAIEKKVSDDKQ